MASKTAATKKRGLGMGLSALLGPDADNFKQTASDGRVLSVPVEYLKPSPHQPRRRFDETELEALAQSIAEKGILQPLVVRPLDQAVGTYEIIAGERRWRAAQRAGLAELPVILRPLNDREVLEVALIENIQRADLSALEEAEAYQRLIDIHGHTQADVAQAVGKSRSHIANTLRLLSLPDELLQHLRGGHLSAGHARALLPSPTPIQHARTVIASGLSVRETESLVRRSSQTTSKRSKAERDPNLVDLESTLSSKIGLSVSIKPQGQGGTLNIRYSSADQLDDLLTRLS